jgi:hypothetical protein
MSEIVTQDARGAASDGSPGWSNKALCSQGAENPAMGGRAGKVDCQLTKQTWEQS